MGRFRPTWPLAFRNQRLPADGESTHGVPPRSRGRSRRKAVRSKGQVDIRLLPDPATMERVIAAIASHQPGSKTYQVMTAVAYYAGLRPSEVVMLRPRCLYLPPTGWGRIDVVEAAVSFDEPGEPKTGRRSVPIPPRLVEILQNGVGAGSFAPDELIFRTRTGQRPTGSNWARAWQSAASDWAQPVAGLRLPPRRGDDVAASRCAPG